MKKHARSLIIVMVIAVVLFPIGTAAEPQNTLSGAYNTGKITITDIIGRKVTLSLPVKRIAYFHPSTADALLILNAWDLVVGKNGWPLDQEIFPNLDKIKPITPAMAMGYTSIDIETLLGLKPDLLILEHFPIPGLDELLADLKGIIPVIVVGTGDYSTINNSFEILGKLLNREAEAEEFIAWSDGLITNISDKLKGLRDKEKTRFFFRMGLSADGDITTGTDQLSSLAGINRLAGGINIAGGLEAQGGWVRNVDPEWLTMQDYDVLIIRDLVPNGFGHNVRDTEVVKQHRAKVMALPAFEKSKPVRNNRVFMVIESFLASPLSIVSFAYFAKAFHPGLFIDMNPEIYLQEYYSRFLRTDIKVEKGVFFYPKLQTR